MAPVRKTTLHEHEILAKTMDPRRNFSSKRAARTGWYQAASTMSKISVKENLRAGTVQSISGSGRPLPS